MTTSDHASTPDPSDTFDTMLCYKPVRQRRTDTGKIALRLCKRPQHHPGECNGQR